MNPTYQKRRKLNFREFEHIYVYIYIYIYIYKEREREIGKTAGRKTYDGVDGVLCGRC